MKISPKYLKALKVSLAKINKPKTFWLRVLFFVAAVGLALFVRFYRITDFLLFNDDMGTEFRVIQEIEKTNSFPLVGPEVGIEGLNSPPTYFVLSYLFKVLTSYDKMVYLYAIFNFLAIILLTVVVWLKNDKNTALIILLLLAINNHFLAQARQIWHPHPVLFFFSLALLLFTLAQKSKNEFTVFLAIFSYSIATSIYISPVIFFPYFFINSYIFFLNKHSQKIKALIKTLMFFFLAFTPIYFTQIIFELSTNFSSLKAITTSSQITTNSSFNFLFVAANNLKLLFDKMIFLNYPVPSWVILIIFILLLIIYLKKINAKKFDKSSLFGWSVAFLLVLFFNARSYHEHRLTELLVFVFLVMGNMIFVVKTYYKKLFNFLSFLLIFTIGLNQFTKIKADFIFHDQNISQGSTDYFKNKLISFNQIEKIIKSNQIEKFTLIDEKKHFDSLKFVAENQKKLLQGIRDKELSSFSDWFLLSEAGYNYELNKNHNNFSYLSYEQISNKPNLIYICPNELTSQACIDNQLFEKFTIQKEIVLDQYQYLVILTKKL